MKVRGSADARHQEPTLARSPGRGHPRLDRLSQRRPPRRRSSLRAGDSPISPDLWIARTAARRCLRAHPPMCASCVPRRSYQSSHCCRKSFSRLRCPRGGSHSTGRRDRSLARSASDGDLPGAAPLSCRTTGRNGADSDTAECALDRNGQAAPRGRLRHRV